MGAGSIHPPSLRRHLLRLASIRFDSLSLLVLVASSVRGLHQRHGLLERHAGQDAQLLASWDGRFPEPEQHCTRGSKASGGPASKAGR